MTRTSLLVAGALLLVAEPVAAQRAVTLSLGGGGSVPVGQFRDATGAGWHALASIGVSTLTQPIGLRLDAGANWFPAKAVGSDQLLTSATLNATYRLPMTSSPLSPYLITGAGAYRLDCTADVSCGDITRFGWNAGLGSRFAALGLKGFVESRLHSMNTDPGALRFVPFTLGLTF
jgi:hypothetical protein